MLSRRVAFVVVTFITLVGAVACKRASPPGPSIIVEVEWPGVDAERAERELAGPLEEALAGLRGADRVTSTSQSDRVSVRVRLASGTDADAALEDARARIGGVARMLPPDALAPVVRREEHGTRPAFRFVATDRALTTLRASEVLDAVGNQLERVPGVTRTEVERGMVREVQVDIDPVRLRALGLVVTKVGEAVRAFVAQESSGAVDIEALARLPIEHAGAVVRLSDVATVADGARPSSDAWPPHGGPPSLIVYVSGALGHEEREALEVRMQGEVMHTRSVLGPGFEFAGAPITSQEGVAVILTGPDRAPLRAAAESVRTAAAATVGVRDVDEAPAEVPEHRVDIERERAAQLGVSVADIASSLQLAMGGSVSRGFRVGTPAVRVRVAASNGVEAKPEALAALSVRSATVGTVPLDQVITMRAVLSPSKLERRERAPAIWMCAGVVKDGTQDDVVTSLKAALASVPLPVGASLVIERGCAR